MSLKNYLNNDARIFLRDAIYKVLHRSLLYAAREKNYGELLATLKNIVPDISRQYTGFELNSDYLIDNVRNLHAFQISLVDKIIEEFEKPVIVDIGDSSGTHLKYLLGIYAKRRDISCLSINLDEEAVKKIKKTGLNALLARAEDLPQHNINADIFLCFETLEHLMDPCHFLHQLSSSTSAHYLIVTVPYLTKSRVGLHHVRNGSRDKVFAENTHIFELCPDDWKLIMKHSGWELVRDDVYLQYPRNHPLRLAKYLWRKLDFEGFYGMILRRNDTWSSCYADW